MTHSGPDANKITETERIADQLERAFYGEAWHGPSVKEALQDVTAAIAAQRPLPGTHSIWELVLHITTWLDAVRRRVMGQMDKVTDEMNFPAIVDTSESAWKDAVERMETAQRELHKTILGLDASRLDQAAVKDGPTVYTLLHGAVQHSLYHAGQIVLLKKAVHKVSVR